MKLNAPKQCVLICKPQMEPKFSFPPHALQNKNRDFGSDFWLSSQTAQCEPEPRRPHGVCVSGSASPPALLSPGPADCGGDRP